MFEIWVGFPQICSDVCLSSFFARAVVVLLVCCYQHTKISPFHSNNGDISKHAYIVAACLRLLRHCTPLAIENQRKHYAQITLSNASEIDNSTDEQSYSKDMLDFVADLVLSCYRSGLFDDTLNTSPIEVVLREELQDTFTVRT